MPGPERLPAIGRQCRVSVQAKLELLSQMEKKPVESGALSLATVGHQRMEMRLKAVYNELHLAKSREVLRGCKHFGLAIDPSTYSGESTCVSVVWCWEQAVAVVPPIKARARTAFHQHLRRQ